MSIPTGHWPGFVARVATPATPEQLAADIAEGWQVVVGGEIPGGCLLACLAQIMLETGTRQVDRDKDGDIDEADQAAGFWNGNAGNVRGTYEHEGQRIWTSFRAGEGFGANEVMLEPGPANRFRSYVGPKEDATDPDVRRTAIRRGVRDFLSLLARKYRPALDAAEKRDYHGYVVALARGGYFTANPEVYARTEAKLMATVEQLEIVRAHLADTDPAPPPESAA